jgi:hypothetical protein
MDTKQDFDRMPQNQVLTLVVLIVFWHYIGGTIRQNARGGKSRDEGACPRTEAEARANKDKVDGEL